MGYTHYWNCESDIDSKTWGNFLEDAHAIVEHSKEILAGGFGDMGTEPCVAPEAVTLNGIEDNSHETFNVTPKATDFDFCKTARKPYDVVVTALLALLKYHAPERFSVRSDGTPEEWTPGILLAKSVTGKDVVCPLELED